ncbi:MAG: prepilin-type N-terminal cleavage/methylation domain-containing protein [Labilithrix sp.]
MMKLLRKTTAKRHRRGFTLTELMVSLVMGLIVALAAVGLARTATTTFHEQARSSTTEMTIRTASNRLRQDLGRASYMSTGNIILDPKVAKFESAGTDATKIPRYPALATLRGIKVDVGMADGGPPATLAQNGLKPDAIELAGNYTTDDAYSGTIEDGAGGTSGDGSCNNAQTIRLDTAADAATFTLGGGDKTGNVALATLTANARAAFMPVAKKQFLAQVTDPMGCNHYVPVCDVVVTGSAPKPVLLVLVDAPANNRAVLYSNSTAAEQDKVARNCGAAVGGRVTIAPLSRIRWSIQVSGPALAPNPAVEDATKKTDLVREVLDFGGEPLFKEVVAEYVVDMKFGLVIDDRAGAGANRQKILDIDSDPGTGDIWKTTSSAESIDPTKPGPQRVRAVRFRLAARASVPDRNADLALDAGMVKARYCVDDDPADCKKGWARVRTVTSEVVLTNQAGMFY